MQIRIKTKLFLVILYIFAGFFSIVPLKSNENKLSEITNTDYLERIPRDDY